MDLPIFTPKTTAELLGITPKALRSALSQDSYSAQDLWALRKALRIYPRPLGHRKQLFLNFKGGTGKTSLSTSYAFRLAELGYRVLMGLQAASGDLAAAIVPASSSSRSSLQSTMTC